MNISSPPIQCCSATVCEHENINQQKCGKENILSLVVLGCLVRRQFALLSLPLLTQCETNGVHDLQEENDRKSLKMSLIHCEGIGHVKVEENFKIW